MSAVSASQLLRALVVATALFSPVAALAQTNGRWPALNAEAVLLIDAEGHTLFAKNEQLDHAPASLVKLMTLYLAFEDLEAERVTLEDSVTISHAAVTTPRYRMGLREHDAVPLRILLEGVAIASANDAATTRRRSSAG
jgi:D-alanyl-D-alanine carboxypeptidase